MRVLIVHDYGRAVGGAEHMSFLLRRELRARGHEARLFASVADPVPGVPFDADAGCFGTMSPLRRVTQVFNRDAARKLKLEIESFKPDVVHVRMFLTQLSPLILPLLRELPAILHVTSYDLICPLDTKTLPDGSPCRDRAGVACRRNGCVPWAGVARVAVQHALVRRNLDVFDEIVANSRWVRDRLRADGVRCDDYVWNGVPPRSARPPLAGPPRVAFAGRLVAKKGAAVLIAAWPTVLRRVPTARLTIAGDGPELANLHRQAAEVGVADSVDFPGHLTHAALEPILAGAWVQAVPSLWEEPFGIVCAEAMMRGTAVLASDGGGLTEQIVDGVTGLLLPPGDAPAWSAAMADLLADRARCESLGAAARVRAGELLTQGAFIDAFIGRYDRLCAAAAAVAR